MPRHTAFTSSTDRLSSDQYTTIAEGLHAVRRRVFPDDGPAAGNGSGLRELMNDLSSTVRNRVPTDGARAFLNARSNGRSVEDIVETVTARSFGFFVQTNTAGRPSTDDASEGAPDATGTTSADRQRWTPAMKRKYLKAVLGT